MGFHVSLGECKFNGHVLSAGHLEELHCVLVLGLLLDHSNIVGLLVLNPGLGFRV